MSILNLSQKLRGAKKGRLATQAKASDLKDAKSYVSAMNEAFVTSSEQQKAAMRQFDSLSKSLAKMEGTVEQLKRAEAENETLSSQAATLETQLSAKTSEASTLDKELAIAKRKLKTAQEDLLTLRSQMTARLDREAENEEEFTQQKEALSSLSQAVEKLEITNLETASLNTTLQKDLSEALGELSARKRSVDELQKNLEDVKAKLKAQSKTSDAAIIELGQLKTVNETLNEQYIESQAALETLEYDTKVARAEFADRLKRRDEEVLGYKSQMAQLEAQVRIKESVKAQAEHDISELQHSLRLANSRAEIGETRAREKAAEADTNAQNVLTIKAEYEALNVKFQAALDDIDLLKKLNHVQKDKLMRYAAVETNQYVPEAPVEVKPAKPAAAMNEDGNSHATKNVTIFKSLKSVS